MGISWVTRDQAGERGWLSGSCLSREPVPAREIRTGDTLVLDDGTEAVVDDVRHGSYLFPEGHVPGVALGWQSGTASGLMFRRRGDILIRNSRPGVAGRWAKDKYEAGLRTAPHSSAQPPVAF